MDHEKLRRRPKRDPISWIRQGEEVEGDPQGSPSIEGVTNRPFKELLENDLELLRLLEEALVALGEVGRIKMEEPFHGDSGAGLSHTDFEYNPNTIRWYSQRNFHQDHSDSSRSDLHMDHTDHLDVEERAETIHLDIEHQDSTIVVPHANHSDHTDIHEDHNDIIDRPHGDRAHTDHNDHQDRTEPVSHFDFHDHSDWHSDYFNPPPHGHTDFHTDVVISNTRHTDCATSPPYQDFYPIPTGYTCAVLTQALRPRPSYFCNPSTGTGHLDYHDHADYPPDSWGRVNGHFLQVPVIGRQHVDVCGNFEHQDGHKEWFYADYTIHNDYPDDVTEHLDSVYYIGYTDHGDHVDRSHADHNDHGDIHSDHSDHGDQPGFRYVNYTDHSDVSHIDILHGDHNDHKDTHSDIALSHLDRAEQTVHEDVPENKHTDHADNPHGDGGAPHLDYTPQNATYHLDLEPVHLDLSHLDQGYSNTRDVSEGTYEEIYPGVWHGDRVWHLDAEEHGDAPQGGQIHTDHSDVELHVDSPHGDTLHQDTYEVLHTDNVSGEFHTDHLDHIDGIPPFQFHGDQNLVLDNRTHEDHSDWSHLDAHLDYSHGDIAMHEDRAEVAATHVDYSHLDHLDHSDWQHTDHNDASEGLQIRNFISYQDHGDSPSIHLDSPHSDSLVHQDYVPEHTDHYDHADNPHGDRAEESFHEDLDVPPEHLDIDVPHGDTHSDHGDLGAGIHSDFHSDHTDHGDYSRPGRHGDYTYSEPHLDYEHLDSTRGEDHYDGPQGPAHIDLYSHSDYPHLDRIIHTDRI